MLATHRLASYSYWSVKGVMFRVSRVEVSCLGVPSPTLKGNLAESRGAWRADRGRCAIVLGTHARKIAAPTLLFATL